MHKSTITLALILLLTACGSQSTPQPAGQAPAPVVEVTRIVQVKATRLVEVTRIVQVEVTRLVEITATPAPSPAEPEKPQSLRQYPDLDASQEQGGITLTLNSASSLPLADMPPDFLDTIADFHYWDDIDTLIAISVTVVNNSDQILTLYPDQGTIVIGDQQAAADTWISDSVGGQIFQGVTRTGVVLFGLPRPIEQAGTLRYIVDSPHDDQYEHHGENFDITVNLPAAE